jgi:hypothetical protein
MIYWIVAITEGMHVSCYASMHTVGMVMKCLSSCTPHCFSVNATPMLAQGKV